MRLALPAALFAAAYLWAPQATVRVDSRTLQPGEVVVISVTTATPAAPVRARAFGRELMPWREDAVTWRVLVGIDLDVAPGTHAVIIDTGPEKSSERTTYDLVVRSKTFPTRTLRVDEAFVNPPASARARIEQEARDLDRCWANPAPTKLWTAAFVRPVPHEANSAFGTRSVFNGEPRSPHGGADFLSPAGTPVKAPNAGRVVLAKPLYYSGNTVVLDHGLGLFSLLAHLLAIDVTQGAEVTAGEVVGRVGATGRVTGPHLHWTVRAGGARVDPLSLLAILGRE